MTTLDELSFDAKAVTMENNSEFSIFILEQNEIIGFIVLIIHLGSKGKSVHVEELWLKSECQNKGIGRKVMEFVEKKYKKQGVRNISLVSDKRSKAFGFYKKLKYESYPEYMLMGKKLEK